MHTPTLELFQQHFPYQPAHYSFAPGRIEFIGNHTDYNGGLVMGAAVTEGITVAVSLRDDAMIQIVSDAGDLVEIPIGKYEAMKGTGSWTNYPIGVTKVMADLGMVTPTGYNMAVTSTLPSGAGMSSSAAFELATAKALAALRRTVEVPPGRARPRLGAARRERPRRRSTEGGSTVRLRPRSSPVRAPEGFAQVGPRAARGAVRARGGVFGGLRAQPGGAR